MLKALCYLGSSLVTASAIESSESTADLVRQKLEHMDDHRLKSEHSLVRNPDEGILFAFELVRHGARTGLEDRDLDLFTVEEGMLTPEGMRERYLLGRYARDRYVDYFELLSAEYNPEEFYIQSTNVNRTMQSGYSELLGLYPPGSGSPLLTAEAQLAVLEGGVSSPPFGVRDQDVISVQLGAEALPEGFAAVPISVFNNDDIHDDVSVQGCPVVGKMEDLRIANPKVWEDFMWMIEEDREPIEELFDLDDEYIDSLDFHNFERLTDTAVTLDFEGYPEHETYFSDEQWELNHEFQKVYLSQRDTHDTSSLEVSRILRKPMEIMREKVAAAVEADQGVSDKVSKLKYVVYSAHDDQITNMRNFLGYDYDWVNYAATVVFELKYSKSCREAQPDSATCFSVSIRDNGAPQLFQECSGDHFSLEGCTFPEFEALISSKWYSGPSAPDLDEACFQSVIGEGEV